MAPDTEPPFGTMLTAMITPFDRDGHLDLDGAKRLANHLVDLGNEGLVINGTTGESATTTDVEKDALLRAVIEAVGDRAHVIAGVGTNDTAHSIHLAQSAARAGADALLVVTPYYNKPTQAGLVAHFTAVADSTELPVMTYDIPGRSGVPITTDTFKRLAEHPRIVANKDAKGDLAEASAVLAATDLAWYCGEDLLNLPLLSIGAVGFVSVVGHIVADRLAGMAAAFKAGDVVIATDMHLKLMPIYTALMLRMPGVMSVKAALNLQELPAGPVRLPLVDADAAQIAQIRADLNAAGVRI
jgi:4-hydroxy-tetrahydrodipicolinate synthase